MHKKIYIIISLFILLFTYTNCSDFQATSIVSSSEFNDTSGSDDLNVGGDEPVEGGSEVMSSPVIESPIKILSKSFDHGDGFTYMNLSLSENAQVFLSYGTNLEQLDLTQKEESLNYKNHRMFISNLSAGVPYYYSLKIINENGDVFESNLVESFVLQRKEEIKEEESENKILPREITWNVLKGPVPAGTATLVGDGKADDGPMLQKIINAASNGDVIYFPSVPIGYRVGNSTELIIPAKNLILYGDGWETGGPPTRENINPGKFSGSKIIRTEKVPTKKFFNLQGSVHFDGLWIDGNYYGNKSGPHGLVLYGTISKYKKNLTIENSLVEGFGSMALFVKYGEDILVRNTFFRRNNYAAMFFAPANNVQVIDSAVYDTGAPEVGLPYYNAYPLVFTASRTLQDLGNNCLVSNVYVEKNPVWVGIHNHGCSNFLLHRGTVDGSLYGIESHGDYPKMHTNHVLDSMTKNITKTIAIGPRGAKGSVSMIGNIMKSPSSGDMRLWQNPGDVVVTWNILEHGKLLVRDNNPPKTLTAAHNVNKSGQPLSFVFSGKTTRNILGAEKPISPTHFTHSVLGKKSLLKWSYPKNNLHDSFQIEFSEDGINWKRLSFTPPNNGLWDFALPTNKAAKPYNPLAYTFIPLSSSVHSYRIRATYRDSFSNWVLVDLNN